MDERVVAVRHVGQYRLHLTFADGAEGEVDFREDIVGKGGVFSALENIDYFASVRVVEPGTIGWDNGVEFAPEVLYHDATGTEAPWAEHARR